MPPKPITLLFTGMNTMADPADLDHQKGECADLLNVDHNRRGGVSRRGGYTQLFLGAFRGGWSDGVTAYVAQGNGIYRFDGTSMTLTNVLLNGVGPVTFCPANDVVVFSSDYELGIVGETSVTPADEPYAEPMAPGACLAFMGSRLYTARRNTVRCSKPYDVTAMDTRHNRVFVAECETRLLLPVDDGMYIVTAAKALFASGRDPFAGDGWNIRTVTSYGGVRGTGVVTDADRMRVLQGASGKAALWTSDEGICAGLSGGQVLNLSRDKVSFATGPSGGAMVRERHGMTHYLSTFRSTGSARNTYY